MLFSSEIMYNANLCCRLCPLRAKHDIMRDEKVMLLEAAVDRQWKPSFGNFAAYVHSRVAVQTWQARRCAIP